MLDPVSVLSLATAVPPHVLEQQEVARRMLAAFEGDPLIRSGPYRLLRHPNYWIVAAEIAVVPLALGLPLFAMTFSVLNAALLRERIRVENKALAGL